MGNAWALYANPAETPNPITGPTFAPELGFDGSRKPRGNLTFLKFM